MPILGGLPSKDESRDDDDDDAITLLLLLLFGGSTIPEDMARVCLPVDRGFMVAKHSARGYASKNTVVFGRKI